MTTTSCLLNDGSQDAPKLRVYLNLDTLTGLPGWSIWPGLEGVARYRRLAADGFEGVQLTSESAPEATLDLPYCGLNRVNAPEQADGIVARHAQRGDLCITVHAGWGIEDDDEVFRLVEAILNASTRHRLPVFLETHRATITQDIWRTVNIARRFPEILFNADFSHYYCGQELVYGDWGDKLRFMEPIFARTGFMHGRIASPGCMQVPIDADLNAKPRQAIGGSNYLEHFKELWTRAMQGFLQRAQAGDVLVFAPELLIPDIYYARVFPAADGQLTEESDRYQQALRLNDLARACFAKAERNLRTAAE